MTAAKQRALVLVESGHVDARDPHAAGVGGIDTPDQVQQGRLARTTAPAQRDGFTAPDRQLGVIENNVIANNSATLEDESVTNYGGGIFLADTVPTVMNNTIVANSAGDYGGAIFAHGDSHPVVENSILYGNLAPFGPEVALRVLGSSPASSVSIS